MRPVSSAYDEEEVMSRRVTEMKSYKDAALYEHSFWLQVLRDHANFIHHALSSKEYKLVAHAENFIHTFDTYLQTICEQYIEDIPTFTKEVGEDVRNFRRLKLSLIEQSINDEIAIDLSTSFLHHMVTELEEYLLVIGYLGKGEKPPVFHELHHHMLWLTDASVHAGALQEELGDHHLKRKSQDFQKHFDHFYAKAVELTGYIKTNLQSFPILDKFNTHVDLERKLFHTFLNEVHDMNLSPNILNNFSKLMADHMAREEQYYVQKLAEFHSQNHD